MILELSKRAFKFLRHITRKSGLEYTDEEIYDMGLRLLTLCQIAAKAEKERSDATPDLTGTEIEALKIFKEHLAATGHSPSARQLSQALGYRSSRSGHLVIKRLQSRGLLNNHGGDMSAPQTIPLP